MDNHQRSLRRAANQAFIESLEQLAVTLQQEEQQLKSLDEPQSPDVTTSAPPIDLQMLEEAAADIEQFMQTLQGD